MIQIQHLHFGYRRKKVFEDLSLTLRPGHIYGLLGKNGTGKSTLLRNIAGLLFPREGEVEVLGQAPRKRQPSFLQQVFLVPEELYFPDVPVRQYVACNAPFYPLFHHQQFENYLKEFEVPTGNSLQKMSYGQKKKVLISFGLAANTKVLLLDEPTNGLDIMSKSQFRKVIAGVSDEQKCIVISTHQVKDLENLIDRVAIIDEGGILFDRTLDEINAVLQFRLSSDPTEISGAIYREEALKGSVIVVPNTDGEEGKVDLELLYKSVVTNGKAVQALFGKSTTQPHS